MKILVMTDIHLTTPGQTIEGRDPNANFEAALDHALGLHPDAEMLAITGDLSDWGDRDDYRRLRARIANLPIPVSLCIGNHDDRAAFAEIFPELIDENGFAQTRRDLSAARCLFLDTVEPGTHAGRFCETRRRWLEAQLEAHDGPFLLFMHHNPVPTHIAPKDTIGLLDDVELRAIIGRRAERIRHIFHGHCHLPMSGAVHGVPVASMRGTNHAGWTDFAEKERLTASDLPQAYGVAFFGPDATTFHMVEFGYKGAVRAGLSPAYADWDRSQIDR